jgi:hypothetical protein
MNGRVFDPSIGRFLSADPIIHSVDNTQNFNRYSYVWNNPLSYTDSSGYDPDVITIEINCGNDGYYACPTGNSGSSGSGGSSDSGSSDGTDSGSSGSSDNSDLGGFYSSGSGSGGGGRTGEQIVGEFRAVFAIMDRFAIPVRKIYGAIASNAVAISNRWDDNLAAIHAANLPPDIWDRISSFLNHEHAWIT